MVGKISSFGSKFSSAFKTALFFITMVVSKKKIKIPLLNVARKEFLFTGS